PPLPLWRQRPCRERDKRRFLRPQLRCGLAKHPRRRARRLPRDATTIADRRCSAPADRSPSFYDFRDDEKVVRLSWRIAQRLLCRKPFTRHVLAENVKNGKRMRCCFDATHVCLTKCFNVLQHTIQLFLKGVCFL